MPMVFKQQAATHRFEWVCTFQNHSLFDLFIFQAAFKVEKSIERYSFLDCARANENPNDERD